MTKTRPTPERTTPERHRPDCTGTDADLSHWRGRRDDRMATCTVCGRVAPVAGWAPLETKPPAAAKVSSRPAPAPVPSRWRCRTHPDEPVRRTARGYAVGCRRCKPIPAPTTKDTTERTAA